ncbi:MAG: hypothetical protein P8L18_10295 [Verrucomicrobiota bacterium]|nr:hypothetical protein [Verrucomicrobiota bacterium]
MLYTKSPQDPLMEFLLPNCGKPKLQPMTLQALRSLGPFGLVRATASPPAS